MYLKSSPNPKVDSAIEAIRRAKLLTMGLLVALVLLIFCLSIAKGQTADPGDSVDAKDIKALSNPIVKSNWLNSFLNQDEATQQNWMLHFQNTDIGQGYPGIASPYSGPNSLPAGGQVRETVSFDLYFGAHIWPGGELYFNPEAYQGFGLGNTLGIASFPNGEAFKAGQPIGNVIIPHLFYRQTFGFGGEQEQLASDELQLAQKVDVSRLTLTVGKMSWGDLFDDNAYSHNQRTQFMNWTLVDSGGIDSPQDADGYTNGIVLHFNQKNWALLWGDFMVTKTVNTHALDYDLTKAWEQILELDERLSINGHPGTVRMIGWLLSAHLGSYWDTVNDPAAGMDITQTAQYRKQFGFAISADQEITKDVGVFTRISWGQPNDEDFMFTDESENLAFGTQLSGDLWGRSNDIVGIGDTIGALSQGEATYYNNGGLGMLIGDGHLRYAPENVTEAYYNAQLDEHVHLTADVQLAENPGFNSDRGPVPIFSLRLHGEF